MIFDNITELIGNTPMLRLKHISEEVGAAVHLKMESLNPMSSVKDRLGLAMIEDAEKKGLLNSNSLIVEPTSGNTGIALAFICAQRGYKLALTMPESMSIERRRILSALGAKLHLTPTQEGMKGAIEKAKEIAESTQGAIVLQQFENQANPDYHEATTGPEIYTDLGTEVAAFVAGVGTGGTFTGVTRFLKGKIPNLHAVAVEPVQSAVLSGQAPQGHKIQGIGAGFIPKVMDTGLIDQIITIDAGEAGTISRRLAKEEGVFLGISAGGNVAAAMKLARQDRFQGKNIVTIACDTGERYLSTWLYPEEN